MLPATSGVTIFHHICNAECTHNVSLFTEKKCDHDEETTGVCEHCQKNIKCCSIDEDIHCIQYVEFLSIDADFVSSSKLKIQPIEVELLFIENVSLFSQELSEKQHSLTYLKQDILKPVSTDISFIIFKSQNKTSEKTSDFFIS